MEKFDKKEDFENYTSVLKLFDEKMAKFNEEGQELSAINNAIRALKNKNISLLDRRVQYAFGNCLNNFKFSDVTPSDRISQDANVLNGLVSELNSEYDDINDIKSSLIAREYHGDNKKIVDQIVENVNGSLEVIDAARNKSQDVLDNNFEKYVDDEIEEQKNKDSVETTENEKKDLDVTSEEENVDVFESRPFDFNEFNVVDFDGSNENAENEENVEEEFHNQDVKTDSIEEENVENQVEDESINKVVEEESIENDNIDKLADLFGDEPSSIDENAEISINSIEDELNKELSIIENDKNNLKDAQADLQVFNYNEASKIIPDGFVKVDKIENCDELNTLNDNTQSDEYSHSMVA